MDAPRIARGPAGYAGAALCGVVGAALFGVALTHAGTALIFLSYMVPVPLFMAGLGAGSFAALTAAFTGAAGLALAGPLSNLSFVFVFLYAAPVAFLTMLALRYRTDTEGKIYWYPEGHLLTAIAVYPVLVFLALAAMASGHEGGLLDMTMAAFKTAAEGLIKKFPPERAPDVHAAIDTAARLAPALAGCAWFLVMTISMAVAQKILRQQDWALRDGFTLQNVYVPSWLMFAVAAPGLAGALAPAPYDYYGKNTAIILGLPYFFAGLAVVHAWASRTRFRPAVLFAFYVLMTFMMWLTILVALLGVVDQWVNIRQRWNNPKPTT